MKNGWEPTIAIFCILHGLVPSGPWWTNCCSCPWSSHAQKPAGPKPGQGTSLAMMRMSTMPCSSSALREPSMIPRSRPRGLALCVLPKRRSWTAALYARRWSILRLLWLNELPPSQSSRVRSPSCICRTMHWNNMVAAVACDSLVWARSSRTRQMACWR